jgi:hypothetical protein
MRRVIAITFTVALLLAPKVVNAGERLFDGALGAASGALVAGPPGLVAGGVIGYAAGPRISRGLGFRTIVTLVRVLTNLQQSTQVGGKTARRPPDLITKFKVCGSRQR